MSRYCYHRAGQSIPIGYCYRRGQGEAFRYKYSGEMNKIQIIVIAGGRAKHSDTNIRVKCKGYRRNASPLQH